MPLLTSYSVSQKNPKMFTSSSYSKFQMTISPQPSHQQFESYQWTTESRSSQQRHGTGTPSQDGRLSAIPDPVERHVARWRSESRNSNKDKVFRNDEEFSQRESKLGGPLGGGGYVKLMGNVKLKN